MRLDGEPKTANFFMTGQFEVKIPATIILTFYKLQGKKQLIEDYCKTMSSKEITALIDKQTGVGVTKGDDYAEAKIYDIDIEVEHKKSREEEVTEMDDDPGYKK